MSGILQVDQIVNTAGTGPVSFPNGFTGAGLSYFAGSMSNNAQWATSSGTYVDGTNSGGNTLTQLSSSGITVVAASGAAPGISWTPPSASAIYLVSLVTALYNSTQDAQSSIKLTDGTSVCSELFVRQDNVATATVEFPLTLIGLYIPGTTSVVTLKTQIKTSAGTLTMGGLGTQYWNLIRIA